MSGGKAVIEKNGPEFLNRLSGISPTRRRTVSVNTDVIMVIVDFWDTF